MIVLTEGLIYYNSHKINQRFYWAQCFSKEKHRSPNLVLTEGLIYSKNLRFFE